MSKNVFLIFIVILFCFCSSILYSGNVDDGQTWIRINQLGYLPNSIKVAVLVSKSDVAVNEFEIVDADSNEVQVVSKKVKAKNAYGPFTSTFRLDFSEFKKQGIYYVKVGSIKSPQFRINSNVYNGTADFMLKYMRQQRCGFNPFLKDSCHTHDGFTIYGPMPDSTHLNVIGGWHDASDYLQYSATSANATTNMLLAYRDFPEIFDDNFQANGLDGKNDIPDILDEANWGLEWLLKMHPQKDWLFNQIADDRDHAGFRSPVLDSTDYGKGLERPIYFCTGEIQGLLKYQNRATGVASTAGKFASAFAAAANIYKNRNEKLAELYIHKALSAYELGLQKPGVCQTAPCKAPYFYEEDNWVDDMELAAAELYDLTSSAVYLQDGKDYAQKENTTPWMGADTARHYQWYPFFNFGHYEMAQNAPDDLKSELIKYYKSGIEKVYNKGKENVFFMGVPFIWCSNNLISAFVTQCYLYRQLSGDTQYLEMESSLRDWLFGCNPWGTSMVIGLPENGVFPKDPHSALTFHYGYQLDGGLIDGPVYGSIYNSLKYVHLKSEDEFAEFQSDLVVYHDDVGDYATNEPTMDGTATLIYYLAAMQKEGSQQKKTFEYNQGGIIRGDKSQKQIALVFTGDEYADGGKHIKSVLGKQNTNSSFFFTGNFYRNPDFENIIKNLKSDGHYLGAHSDKHLLYCTWDNRDSLLIDKTTFLIDLENNYKEMAKFGINKNDANYFMPPFEWYNQKISDWTTELGLQLINFTPGTRSNADYTIPSMGERYVDSNKIYDSIINYEQQNDLGLNGFILFIHIGTHPERTDKFYMLLDKLIDELKVKDYKFVTINKLLD
jgi:endoglucanase